ncbi:hypothetical protein M404DRAFT_942677, partial [Pisolithus tinctorius Marx 270]
MGCLFIREVWPQARPVRFPDDPYFIHNACKLTTLQIATNVKLHDTFWLKDQKYSLYDMLSGNEEYALPFVGGIVYQGSLVLKTTIAGTALSTVGLRKPMEWKAL